MGTRRAFLRASIATLGLFASMLVVQAAFPAAAQARCRGVNDPVLSTLNVNGRSAAYELPAAGTCNSNNRYEFIFRSNANLSGVPARASVWIQNNGRWTPHYGGYDHNWYSSGYSDNNSHSYMSFCLNNRSGGTWVCGWGDNWVVSSGPNLTYYGTNRGF